MDRTKAEWETQRTTSIAEVVRGSVSEVDLEYAREKVDHATRVAFGPVQRLELRLTQHDDPARTIPAFVEMHAVIQGRPVRAHRAAPTMHEAIDATAQVFTQQIERAQDRRESKHQRLADPSSWHHGDASRAGRRAEGVFPRPAEQRALVRRKQFRLEAETVDEAILDLELLDHDFFLFRNIDTDAPNLIARSGDGYLLHEPHPVAESRNEIVGPVTIDPATAPACSIEEARLLLALRDDTAAPLPQYMFFVDADTGAGAVVYRRLDGHDGLISAD